MSFFDNHTHTWYSNIRLLDSINNPKELIQRAIDLGLEGIAITDHECLSAHIKVNQIAKELQESNPTFTIALGNEVYLVDERKTKQKYYHFILIAKDEIGHKQLRQLSSLAWLRMYEDYGERVPILKKELKQIIQKDKGHIIATSACLGGELGNNILALNKAEKAKDDNLAKIHYQNIIDFMLFSKEVFGEDFYVECAPSESKEQIEVNKRLIKIAKAFNVKMSIGSDAHYLKKEDRYVHKSYLNSSDGEREVDAFYEYTYLMSPEEAKTHLLKSFSEEEIDWIFSCSIDIKSKIKFYDLNKKQIIPKVEVTNYPKISNVSSEFITNCPTIKELLISDNVQERCWINEVINGLKELNLFDKEHIERIETEADVIKFIGEKLEDCLFAYFNTFKHYIDLFWDCGSIVGPGRGSATGFLSNFALGITQLEPIKWGLPWYRFLNKERAELPEAIKILGSCKKRTLTIA